ncbi:hypothetical protein BH23CHL5_BH23CHL5_28050 [soil metagenome]
MQRSILSSDPLGVLASTLPVIRQSEHVRLVDEAVAATAGVISDLNSASSAWGDDLHFRDGTWRTAGWVMALDALNFCFWSESVDPDDRWRVEYGGQLYDGYWALVAALRRAVDEGVDLWKPQILAGLSAEQVSHMLRPAEASTPGIPLLDRRVRHLIELGEGLLAFQAGSVRNTGAENPVEAFVLAAEGSAARLVEEVVRWFPSFDDVAEFRGSRVRFLKRAQILVADLHGGFCGEGLGRFDDLSVLTAFADYKVPQVLRRLGILEYAPGLADRIERRELIAAGSAQEVEIRAATIWAVELVRQQLAERGRVTAAYEIDWALWQAGQRAAAEDRPYHRTVSWFY